MTNPNERQLEMLLDQFESQWDSTSTHLESWVEENGSHLDDLTRSSLIEELVRVDLELSWRNDRPAMLEQYKRVLPKFTVDILAEEYRVRHRWGDQPKLAEYADRFGQLGKDLAAHLNVETLNSAKVYVPRPEEKIGRFQVVREIGSGSFGTVFLARDPTLSRLVAIKVPKSDSHEFDEAILASSVSHPSFVKVFDIVQETDRSMIVMEYVNGCSLDAWRQSPEFSLAKAIRMLAEIVIALGHAHEKGLVHCDIKPTNILVDESFSPRITDFGLAIQLNSQRSMSSVGAFGTPAYMSPEQVRGELRWLDGRTDIWAVGVLLYELLTNRLPFKADNPAGLFDEILYQQPTAPKEISSRVPGPLDELCMACLQKRVSDRMGDIDQLAETLFTEASKLSGNDDQFHASTKSARATKLEETWEIPVDSDLPASMPLIGRERELGQCVERLRDPATKLLTLHGLGGVGKSALAVDVAWKLATDYDGIWFLDLSNVTTEDGLRAAFIDKLHLEDDVSDLQIITAMRSKSRLLLVLDGFDHLVPHGVALIERWLAKLTRCQVLATSRVRLGASIEQLIPIGPLSTNTPSPKDDGLEPLSAGAQLFDAVARRAEPSFAIEHHISTVNEICQRLDGIPLGIELAGSRTAILDPPEILARLESKSLSFSGKSSGPERHRSLRDAIHWSLDLLSEESLLALRLLAQLPDGCFTAVADQSLQKSVSEPLDCIQLLRDHSLLRMTQTEFGKRIGLYRPIREFVLQQSSSPTDDQIRNAYEAVVESAAELDETFQSNPAVATSEKLLQEKENLRQAQHWAADNGYAELAAKAALCLVQVLGFRGSWNELHKRLDDVPESKTLATRVQLLLAKSRSYLALGKTQMAMQEAKEACQIAEQEPALDDDIARSAELMMGSVLLGAGNWQAAHDLFQRLHTDSKLAPKQRFDVCLALGQIHRHMGQLDLAEQQLKEAQRHADVHQNSSMRAEVLRRLGNLMLNQGDAGKAVELFAESKSLFESIGYPRGVHLSLTSQGVACCEQREFEKAIELFDEAQKLATQLGEARAIAVNEGNRGIALAELGDHVAAIHSFTRARELNLQIEQKAAEALNRANRAVSMAALGELEAAREVAQQAVLDLEAHGDDLNAAYAEIDLGIIVFLLEEYAPAALILESALKKAENVGGGGAGPVLPGQIVLAESLLADDRRSDAKKIYEKFGLKAPFSAVNHMLLKGLDQRTQKLSHIFQSDDR